MEVTQRLVFFFFCVTCSFGQRIPQVLFDPIVATTEQQARIQVLDTIDNKTEEEHKELAMLLATTGAYEKAFEEFDILAEVRPDSFTYHYLLGGMAGILASELPTMKSLSYVRSMKIAFETAATLNPESLDVQLILLELYTELPWILGGSSKKAQQTIRQIRALSIVEGYLAEGYYFRMTNQNKDALVAYLKAINEIQNCIDPIKVSNNAYYLLGVLSFFLQKDTFKAQCFFNQYLTHFSAADRYPKSFANHYIATLKNPKSIDESMQQTLEQYDLLTAWIQNNFK